MYNFKGLGFSWDTEVPILHKFFQVILIRYN